MAQGRSRQKSSKRCPICSQVFSRHTALKGHLNAHKKKRPFTCSICGDHFTRQNERRNHEKEQHDDGATRFTCAGITSSGILVGCGKTFARKTHLGRHLRGPRARRCRNEEITLAESSGTQSPELDLSVVPVSTSPMSQQSSTLTVFSNTRGSRHRSSAASSAHTASSPQISRNLDDYDLVDHFQVTYNIAKEAQVIVARYLRVPQSFTASAWEETFAKLHQNLTFEARNLMGHNDLVALRLCHNALFGIDAARRNDAALLYHAKAVQWLHSLFEQYGNRGAKRRSLEPVRNNGMWSFGGRHYLPMTQVRWLTEHPHLLLSGDVALHANERLESDLDFFELEFFM